MVELGALYRLCVSVCLSVCLYSSFKKKTMSPNDCKITKKIKLRMLETLPEDKN